MSNFDPNTFMTETQEGELSTQFTPVPEAEYDAIISDVKAEVAGNGSPVLNVTWLIDSAEAREFTGMTEPTVRQTVWLDLDDNGRLELGANKNVQLGKLRDALGQNDGSAWSPSMMVGVPARVLIKHNPSNKGDGVVYANVAAVTAR